MAYSLIHTGINYMQQSGGSCPFPSSPHATCASMSLCYSPMVHLYWFCPPPSAGICTGFSPKYSDTPNNTASDASDRFGEAVPFRKSLGLLEWEDPLSCGLHSAALAEQVVIAAAAAASPLSESTHDWALIWESSPILLLGHSALVSCSSDGATRGLDRH